MQRGGPRSLLVCLTLVLVTACGARLTPAQMRAATDNGTGTRAADAGAETSATPAINSVDPVPNAAADSVGPGEPTGPITAAPAERAGPAAAAGGGIAPGAACQADPAAPPEPGVTADSISLGNVSTVSGPVSGLFAGARDGAKAFFAYQNSVGGVCGRKLVQVFADDGLDAAGNKRAYDTLTPKVLGFVGSFSVVDEGGAQSLKASGVPDVSQALAKAHFDLPNNFSPQPIPKGWPTGAFEYFKKKFNLPAPKMLYMIQNARSVLETADGQEKVAKQVGYTFPCRRVFEPTDTSFDGDAQCAKANKVNGVIVLGEAGAMGRIAQALAKQGLTPGTGDFKIATYGANAYDPKFLATAGSAANGVILNQAFPLYAGEDAGSNPEVALFNKFYRQVTNGKTPDLFAVYGWASGRLMAQGLLKAGPRPTRANVRAALSTVNSFDSNGLIAKADPAGKGPAVCFALVTVVNGRFARVPDNPSGLRCEGTYVRIA